MQAGGLIRNWEATVNAPPLQKATVSPDDSAFIAVVAADQVRFGVEVVSPLFESFPTTQLLDAPVPQSQKYCVLPLSGGVAANDA